MEFYSEAIQGCPVDISTRFDTLASYYMTLSYEVKNEVRSDFHQNIELLLKGKHWMLADYEDLLRCKEFMLDGIHRLLGVWHALD